MSGEKAQIVESETTKKATVYKICVSSGGNSWFILRRYKEFSNLYDRLKKQYPEAGLKLPSKPRFFGGADAEYLRQRREALHSMVQILMTHPQISELPDVINFLGLDVNPSRLTSASTSTATHASAVEGAADTGGGKEEENIDLGAKENRKATPSDFAFLKVIGKGSFGKVFLAKRKSDGRIFAVKVLQKEQIKKRNEVKHIMSERNVLVRNIEHPFLCALHMSFRTPDKLYFVLDYVNGGELFFHLQRERSFSESRARFYAAEIASAIGYLHSKSIIYRDLKPENILLDSEGHVRLTDFGLCKEGLNTKSTTSTFCGTPEYLAPEVLRKEPYDMAVDWWCLGSVLYEMLFGLPPFYSREKSEMYSNILHKPLQLKPSASSASQDVLNKLLQKSRQNRLGSNGDIQEVRKHPFFATIDWQLLEQRKIEPPFKPKLMSPLSTEYIDSEFTREPVPQSVGRSIKISASVQEADNDFMGFSYVPPTFVDSAGLGTDL
ncbi:hypothetical protein BOX15_Mlig007623g1 [Macrostomum lignano]|uniref:Non-specific serine/threonine protein kinase n=2 Tax=Macrostomum lignano TaxID=282301 RepID=A0A267FGH5_9PLAT|nr:hypothetical protein BOX15_Mlig007623g1 [Macrostomum lignano]